MTIKQLADEFHLWRQIEAAVDAVLSQKSGSDLLEKIAPIPVRSSRATRRLGVYVFQGRKPVCIRLQFAQETKNLKQTFLHEVAHVCDHLSCWELRKSCRQTHGESWRMWARALDVSTAVSGESEALRQLYQQRLKLVGVCQKCGAEFFRLRRLNSRQIHTHNRCGGRIRQF